MSKACVFFDRDGVVNISPGPGYVERLSDFHIIPEIIDVFKLVNNRGYLSIIITNQRGVALGCMTMDTVNSIHAYLRKTLIEKDCQLQDIMVCPHDNGECSCRKPLPGMLLTAAKLYDIDLNHSWMIGDSERDISAGAKAGCKTIYLGNNNVITAADYVVKNHADLQDLLCDKLTQH